MAILQSLSSNVAKEGANIENINVKAIKEKAKVFGTSLVCGKNR